MIIEFDYNRKSKALLFLRKEYILLVNKGTHNPGMEIMFNKIVELNKQLKELDKQIPVRYLPFGNYQNAIKLI